jgi:hypothetical protein
MSIFTAINDWFTARRLNRLESDLMRLQNKITFEPKYIPMSLKAQTSEEFTRRISEYLVWFMGNAKQIRGFYAEGKAEDKQNYFWTQAPDNYLKLHTGIPNTISNKMAVILFGGGYTTKVEIYKINPENGTVSDKIDEAKSKAIEDTIQVLSEKTGLKDLLEEAAQTESWSGHLFVKFSYDTALSQFPIIEVVDIRNAEVEKERGITKSITFKNWYEYGTMTNKRVYCHKEIYTTNDAGEAVIQNKLEELKSNGDIVECALTDIEETKELDPEITFTGLKGMIAFDKPNKTPNNEFPDSPYGASDYMGAIDSFDALDEVYSEIIKEIRDNKTMRYIPDNMMEVDDDGVAKFNPYVTNHVKVHANLDQNSKNEINITEIADKTEQHKEKWKVALTTAINKAGLSPLALGITGLEAVNAGEQSQRERNKATLETRAMKLKKWTPFLAKLLLKLLEFNSWMQRTLGVNQEGVDKIEVDWTNCNVFVKFGDYITDSIKDKRTELGNAKQQGIMSIEQVIEEQYPDWSEEQKLAEVNRIKFEQNMAFDTPDTLQGLSGKDTEPNPDEGKPEDNKGKEKEPGINNGSANK